MPHACDTSLLRAAMVTLLMAWAAGGPAAGAETNASDCGSLPRAAVLAPRQVVLELTTPGRDSSAQTYRLVGDGTGSRSTSGGWSASGNAVVTDVLAFDPRAFLDLVEALLIDGYWDLADAYRGWQRFELRADGQIGVSTIGLVDGRNTTIRLVIGDCEKSVTFVRAPGEAPPLVLAMVTRISVFGDRGVVGR